MAVRLPVQALDVAIDPAWPEATYSCYATRSFRGLITFQNPFFVEGRMFLGFAFGGEVAVNRMNHAV